MAAKGQCYSAKRKKVAQSQVSVSLEPSPCPYVPLPSVGFSIQFHSQRQSATGNNHPRPVILGSTQGTPSMRFSTIPFGAQTIKLSGLYILKYHSMPTYPYLKAATWLTQTQWGYLTRQWSHKCHLILCFFAMGNWRDQHREHSDKPY